MHSDTGGRRIRPDRAIMRPDMREAAFGFNEIESSSTTYSDGGGFAIKYETIRAPRSLSGAENAIVLYCHSNDVRAPCSGN